MNLFDYISYRTYLNDFVQGQDNKGRGWNSKIARNLDCHNSYITLVLKGQSDFSLEQAWKLNTLLGHTKEQSEYFLLLVQYDRAGTFELKNYLKNKVEELQKNNKALSSRIGKTKKIPLHDQMVYYSSPIYALIHVLCSIEKFQTTEAIAQAIKEDVTVVADCLEKLKNMNLVSKKNKRWISNKF